MRLFAYVSLIVILMVSFHPMQPVQALQAALVVEPANMQDWEFGAEGSIDSGSGSFVNGPATAPLGKGSARLVLENSTAGWILGRAMHAGTLLSDITRLEYSTYVTQNDGAQAIALSINVDYDLTDASNAWQGRLVYEPYHNGSVTKDTWQTWDAIFDDVDDANDANWFASGAPGNGPCPMSSPCTWSEVQSLFPNAGFHSVYGAVIFKAGSGWTSFDGNVDNFVIGIDGVDEVFDFEPSAVVYVDDDWSTIADYTDPDGTGPANAMGLDAAATVQGGVDLVAAGGTVMVAAGTYEEQVIVRNLDDITIQGAGQTETSIVSPPVLTALVGDRKPVVLVEDSENVTIQDLTVDGAGLGNANSRMFGVMYHNASGLMDSLTVVDIRNSPLGGGQHGVAIYGFNSDAALRTLTVNNSTASGYQKGGYVFHGAGLTAIVTDKSRLGLALPQRLP